MGEVEFFDKVKGINRFLSNEARFKIWEFILTGEFIPIPKALEYFKEGVSEDIKKMKEEIIK